VRLGYGRLKLGAATDVDVDVVTLRETLRSFKDFPLLAVIAYRRMRCC
jgi:hypothetical protein